MEWGYIPINKITTKHIKFYQERGITHIVKNNRVYVRGSKFLETLKISTRPVGRNKRGERLLKSQSLLTYKTRIMFNGASPVYGVIATSRLGEWSALMVNPLEDWSEVLPVGLLGI